MSVQTLKVAGRDFVILPKREYDDMRAKLQTLVAQEKGDLAEARRRAREPSIPLAAGRRHLGR